MSNRALPKHETTLLLDDIREEKNEKFSLIGLYARDIILDTTVLPLILPKLCFFTRIYGGEGDFNINYSIQDPDGEELLASLPTQAINAKNETFGNLVFILSPFNIKKLGEYKFRILINNKEFYSMIFAIRIKNP